MEEQKGIQELLEVASGGDKAAENRLFSCLCARFLPVVRRRIWRPGTHPIELTKDADDIVQNALEAIRRNYERLESRSKFLPWAFIVLRNKIRDYMREIRRAEQRLDSEDGTNIAQPGNEKDVAALEDDIRIDRGRRRATVGRVSVDELPDDRLPDDHIDVQILIDAIKKAAAKLGAESQRIILALLEGYSCGGGGIAGVIRLFDDVSRRTIDSKIHRCRKRLQAILKKEGYLDEVH